MDEHIYYLLSTIYYRLSSSSLRPRLLQQRELPVTHSDVNRPCAKRHNALLHSHDDLPLDFPLPVNNIVTKEWEFCGRGTRDKQFSFRGDERGD